MSQQQKKKQTKKKTYSSDEIFLMINDTSSLIAQENATLLSAIGPAANESGLLTDSVEFWQWMNRNYSHSGIFASPENLQQYLSTSPSKEQWARNIVQGKGNEWDWMSAQRRAFQNLFKTFDAGDVANRPGSDITVHDIISGSDKEYQLKAITSNRAPDLHNTPKNMAVVVNEEHVNAVEKMGYKEVIPFGDNQTIKNATDSRIQQAKDGTARMSYSLQNVGLMTAKAGITGFFISATMETMVSYKKWKSGRISASEYLTEILKSGGNAGAASAFSAGILVPITATITAAGVTSLITIPISFAVSASINKIVAPAFARGDYLKILTEAQYYQQLTDYTQGMVQTMIAASTQYEQFISSIANQTKAFYSIRGEVVDQRMVSDLETLAKEPKEKIALIVADMLALLRNTDLMADALKEQKFYQFTSVCS